MACYGQGRCRFCCKRHALPIFGHDEAEHEFLRGSNFKLVVLNTVCSVCIAKIEDHLKKTGLGLPTEGTIIRRLDDVEDQSDSTIVQEKTHDVSLTRDQVQSTTPGDARLAPTQPEAETSEHANDDASRRRLRRSRLTCDFCRKEFSHAGDLNKHRRTHTGEQPYTCDECPQRFSYASNLARHRRMHSGEKPFSCRICGRSFARKDKFSAHLTTEQCIVRL